MASTEAQEEYRHAPELLEGPVTGIAKSDKKHTIHRMRTFFVRRQPETNPDECFPQIHRR